MTLEMESEGLSEAEVATDDMQLLLLLRMIEFLNSEGIPFSILYLGAEEDSTTVPTTLPKQNTIFQIKTGFVDHHRLKRDDDYPYSLEELQSSEGQEYEP